MEYAACSMQHVA